MKFRRTAAAAAAVLAMAGLAGCKTNVGTAAWVDGHRITESDVSNYINPSGIDPALAARAQQQGQTIQAPRAFVLEYLIQESALEQALQKLGIRYTPGTLAASHDSAAALLLQTQVAGAALDTAIDKALPGRGVKAGFRDVFLRVVELQYQIVQARHLTQFAQLAALLRQMKISISVNPRYGAWDARSMGLSGPVVPSYLTPLGASGTASILGNR